MGENVDETESPDVSAKIDTDAPAPEPDSSASSTEPAGEEFDLLSVVRSATEEAEQSETPADEDRTPEATAESERTEDTPPPGDPDADPTDDEMKSYPVRTRKRIERLLEQRNQFRQGAEQYEQVQTFLQEHGVSAEEAADGILIQALIKTNPVEAWKKIKPIAQKLAVESGEMLPADLREQVQAGRLSREHALEMSRLRAAQSSAARQTEFQQRQAEQQRKQAAVQAVQHRVAQWEQATRARDPDFDAIGDDMQREVAFLQRQHGMPRTPAEAEQMIQTAYDSVRKRRTAFQPKPAKAPVTGGRVSSGQPTAEPKSMLDLVRGMRSTG